MAGGTVAAVVAASLVVGGWVATSTDGAAPADDSSRRPALVERSVCAGARAGPVHEPTGPDGVGQTITVTVPATATLHLDNRGRVVAAWTNTGCAPRPGDDLFLVHPDGTIEPSPAPLPTRTWIGDFREAGVPQRQ